MTDPALSAADLHERIADPRRADPACRCASLAHIGWESIATPVGEPLLGRLGTLRDPAGTRFGSADAPVAVGFFPYNRCEVWQCRDCGRGFLQYTECRV